MQPINNNQSIDDYADKLRQSLQASREAVYGQQSGGENALGYRMPDLNASAGQGPDFSIAPDPAQANQGMSLSPPEPMRQPQQNRSLSIDQVAGGDQKKSVGPPKPPELKFNNEKLKDAKTVPDIVGAANSGSLNNYMNWWEKQYGDINAAHDHMLSQLGQRPNEDRKMSRKEKWTALMDFGINLIKSSQGRGNDTAGTFATAIGATAEGETLKRKQEGGEYDARRGGIENSRAAQLKGIGNYGDALEGQAKIDNQAVQAKEAQARMSKAENAAPDTLYSDQGIQSYDSESRSFKPVLGVDGKPLTNLKVGAHGGSAASRDNRTANQRNIDDLMDRGMPENLATDIVYKKATDPRKAWQDIYRDRRRQYADEATAKKEADTIIARFYGPDWESGISAPDLLPKKDASGPKKISNKADYDELPSGSTYIDPSGKQRTKK